MIGKVHLFNKNSSKISKTIDYEELVHNEELKFKLRDNYLNKDSLIMVCGCNKNIELGIDKIGRVYHKKKEDIHSHNQYCYKHPNFKNNSTIIGWRENEDTPHIISSIKLNCCKNTDFKMSSKNCADIDDFIKLLNLYTWNNFIYRNRSLPKDKFEFLNRLFGVSNFIKIKNFNNSTLNSLFFNVGEYKQVTRNDIKFTYMYMKEFKIIKEKNIVSISGEYAKNKTFSFNVNRSLFTQKFMSLKNESKLNSPLIIAGFVIKRNNHFEFVDFSILRVNYKGVFCKDEYEVDLFNMFCKNKILFVKPYRPIPIYNGHKPNAVLIGNNKRNIFVEIFSSNSLEALSERDKLIDLMETVLKKTHYMIRWDVYNNKNLPSISYIKKLQSNGNYVKK